MKKFLLYFLSATIIVFIILYLFFNSLIDKSIPNYSEDFNSKSIISETVVYRDSFGIPTISASNHSDLYFALGYTQAQDRIFQMDILRRMGEGRLSEIYGLKTVNTDIFYRTIRLNSISLKQIEGLSADERNILTAYTKGVNHYIESNQNKLPIEFSILNYKPEIWTDVNSLLIFNLFQWWMDKNPDEIIKEMLLSDSVTSTFFNKENAFLLDYFKNEKSTAVIIPAKHSLSGKPLFYSEISGIISIPAKYYEYFFDFNGTISGGISLPGIPVILSGVSSTQAWSFTSLVTSKKIELINYQNLKTEKNPEVISVRDEESINLLIEEFEGKINVSGLIFPGKGSNLFLSWKSNKSFSEFVGLLENQQISDSDHLLVLNRYGELNQSKIQNPNQDILILQNGFEIYKLDFRGKADSVDAAWMSYFLNEKLLGTGDLKAVTEIPDFNYSMKIKSILLQQLYSDSSLDGNMAKKYLSVWRADFTNQDIGASIFSLWNYLFVKHYSNVNIQSDSKKKFQESTLNFLLHKPDADSIAIKTIIKSIQILKSQFGEDPSNWRWANLNLHVISNLLPDFVDEIEKIKMDNTGYNFINEFKNDNEIIFNSTGKQFILFTDFRDQNNINMIIPGGISGQFASFNFKDQLTLFNSHQFLNFDMSGLKNSKFKLTIRPEK